MIIEKTAVNKAYVREISGFPRARDGFKSFLAACGKCSVLLPAYIGYSAREGSGVFDPVRELDLPSGFYKMDDRLHIDLSDLEHKLETGRFNVFVIIHYFGHVDPNYTEAIRLARKHGCLILEDEAHALFSDLVDGKCGRLGDAAIYSLHKMLPVKDGGALVVNSAIAGLAPASSGHEDALLRYDLTAIARRRKEHVRVLAECLAAVEGASALWPEPDNGETWQTFPVVIETANRDRLYDLMNEAGYGVVSLYHTMIGQITPEDFPASHRLSRKVMNLPVHQDATEQELRDMVRTLQRLINELK